MDSLERALCYFSDSDQVKWFLELHHVVEQLNVSMLVLKNVKNLVLGTEKLFGWQDTLYWFTSLELLELLLEECPFASAVP